MENIEKFRSITIAIQSEEISISTTNLFFQKLISEIPDFPFKDYIGVDARIVHSKDFENAIIKIQEKNELQLTNLETIAVEKLLKPNPEVINNSNLTWTQKIIETQKLSEDKSSYIDTYFLKATSCPVERCFAFSKRVYSPKRRSLTPKTLSALIFLNRNKHLWDYKTVLQIFGVLDEIEAIEEEGSDDEEYY